MKQNFLDTSGLIAVANTDDQWHSEAERVWTEIIASRAQLVTTSLVLIEIGDGLSRVDHRPLALETHRALHFSERVQIVQSNNDLEGRAWQLFQARPDKDWRTTDCASMVLMRDQNIIEVFSTDHHFEQAGFEILLSSRTS